MVLDVHHTQNSPLRIGIIGAGFSGTALTVALHRLSDRPLEVFLFDKTGHFGAGAAYRTHFPFHLLNVRAEEMSAFENAPSHFVDWLKKTPEALSHLDQNIPTHLQFVPRFLYRHYLKYLLETVSSDASQKMKLSLEPIEVMDIRPTESMKYSPIQLILGNGKKMTVDKVVLALGNQLPTPFSFSIPSQINCIHHPWDYAAPQQIAAEDPVLIMGTGLSMIDTVLTLYHHYHRGKIYTVSRHGLLPLPHSDTSESYSFTNEQLPHVHGTNSLRAVTRELRKISDAHITEGGDWRSVMNVLRAFIPTLWAELNLSDKKRFLRHVLPYWNIHRHRVHPNIAKLMTQLQDQNQLTLLGGRVIGIENGEAMIQSRYTHHIVRIKVKWLINCMGPSLHFDEKNPLLHSLLQRGMVTMDSFDLGFNVSYSLAIKDVTGKPSATLYTLGPPVKGTFWECSAVPEIRKQSFLLAKALLN